MRRVFLLIFGLGGCAALLTLLCITVAAQYVRLQMSPVECSQQQIIQQISFPCRVEDTGLLAVRLASYDGPFLEDGSDEEVTGVAALVVENIGEDMVYEGAVILSQGGRFLVFEVMALPPGGCALVLEKDRCPYALADIDSCWGWVERGSGLMPQNLGVQQLGRASLLFSNLTEDTICEATVLFKSYDPVSGMYIGGIAYSVRVGELAPGEVRLVTPYHYASGYSKVVGILPKES